MKIYIETDIEGVAGFCFFENRADKGYENIQHRHRMHRLLTDEVNAAVRAAFDSGADDVLVKDGHGSGYNIIFENLDPRCRIIHGRNCSGPHWLPLLDASCEALVLVGMHAMGGTPNAILPHSKWKVNGGAMYLSEGSMAAAIAGDIEHKEMLPEDIEAPTIDQAFMEFERRMSWNCFDTSKVDGFVFP